MSAEGRCLSGRRPCRAKRRCAAPLVLSILGVLAGVAGVAGGDLPQPGEEGGGATARLLAEGKARAIAGRGSRWRGIELGAGGAGATQGGGRAAGRAKSLATETALFEGPETDVKVEVVLFTSAGCTACRLFWTTILSRTLQKAGMWGIVDFSFVAWGAGRVLSTTGGELNSSTAIRAADVASVVLECPGGAGCKGEKYAACVAALYPKGEDFFPVINCIQGRGCVSGEAAPDQCFGSAEELAPTCIQEWGAGEWGAFMNVSRVEACAAGEEGDALLLENAARTLDAAPAFVPWVTVNGRAVGGDLPQEVHGLDRLALLGRAICLARQEAGGQLPEACEYFPQTLSEVRWEDMPQHLSSGDDGGFVPHLTSRSDRVWWTANAVAGLMLTAGIALLLASTFCSPGERPGV